MDSRRCASAPASSGDDAPMLEGRRPRVRWRARARERTRRARRAKCRGRAKTSLEPSETRARAADDRPFDTSCGAIFAKNRGPRQVVSDPVEGGWRREFNVDARLTRAKFSKGGDERRLSL